MPRGRFHSRKESTDHKLWIGLSSDTVRLFYNLLINWLDAEGRFSGDPTIIKGQVCPYADWSVSDIETMLDECEAVKRDDGTGLLNRYSVRGMKYLFMAGFEGEQVGLVKYREAKGKHGFSDIPPPPAKYNKKPDDVPETAVSLTVTDIDEELKVIIELYEKSFGHAIGGTESELLKAMLDESGLDELKEAITTAKVRKVKIPIKYIGGILANKSSDDTPPEKDEETEGEWRNEQS